MQAFNVANSFLTKSSGYVKIAPSIPGIWRLSIHFEKWIRVEKNSHYQAHTPNSYDRVKLFAWLRHRQERFPIGVYHRRYRIAASSLLAQPISSGWRQPEGRSRDNRIVYDKTPDVCLPPLALSASRTMKKSDTSAGAQRDECISARPAALKRWAAF